MSVLRINVGGRLLGPFPSKLTILLLVVTVVVVWVLVLVKGPFGNFVVCRETKVVPDTGTLVLFALS